MTLRGLVLLICILMCTTIEAVAHASLLEATPPDDAVVDRGDLLIQLRFDSRLDTRFSQLTLVKPDGSRAPLMLQTGASPNVLQATGAALDEGHYLLHWQVLSVDGHGAQGRIKFQVGR